MLVAGWLLAACTAAHDARPPSGAGLESVPSSSAGPTAGALPTSAATGLPTPEHVVVVIFENKATSQVLGSASAPFLTTLAAQGASFSDAHGETHPSQPNYLALFSGSTQGVIDDSCPLQFTTDNLAAQLLSAGKTFTGYSEALPMAGYTGCSSGEYARKHNPWVDFPGLPATVNQPLSALPADFADLPTVSFLVPDLCNDMHNCPVAQGDRWAQAYLPSYISWASTHNSLLVITFDEDNGTAANRIPMILIGPMVRPMNSNQRIDHLVLLRTVEDMYGLPHLGMSAAASPLQGVWR